MPSAFKPNNEQRCRVSIWRILQCGAVRCGLYCFHVVRFSTARIWVLSIVPRGAAPPETRTVRCGSIKTGQNGTAPYAHRRNYLSSNAERPRHGFCSCDNRSLLFDAECLGLNGGGVASVRESYGAVRCGCVKGKIIRNLTAQ